MKKLGVTLIILLVLGVYGCPTKAPDATLENKVRNLLQQKRDKLAEAGDIQADINKLIQQKKAADMDEKALKNFFHPETKPAVATSAGVK